MRKAIGFTLIVVGMMVAAGSAGDCDGKCMEYANDFGTMLMVAATGVFAMIVGALAIFTADNA